MHRSQEISALPAPSSPLVLSLPALSLPNGSKHEREGCAPLVLRGPQDEREGAAVNRYFGGNDAAVFRLRWSSISRKSINNGNVTP